MKINIIVNLLKRINTIKENEFKNKEINSINKTNYIIFLSKILERGIFDFPSINLLNKVNEKDLQELINLIDKFINKEKEEFIFFRYIIELLKENTELFNIINIIFPYNKIKNNNKKRLSILWLQLFEKLYKKKNFF